MDAFICYKQKCKVVSLNLGHPLYALETVQRYAISNQRQKYWSHVTPQCRARKTIAPQFPALCFTAVETLEL